MRAEKTPFEPDLGHASVGKYKAIMRASGFEAFSRFYFGAVKAAEHYRYVPLTEMEYGFFAVECN